MARTQYTVTFPAAKAGDQVTWPTTVKVYQDKDAQVPLQPGQSLSEALTFSGWSESASVTFARRKTDGTTEALTVTSAAPTGTGAAPTSTNAASGADPVTTIAASGTTQTLTLGSGGTGTWDITLTGNLTPTLAGASAGKACVWTLFLRQDATGSRTVAWPASIAWQAQSAPALSTANGAYDIVQLVSLDGGSTFTGMLVAGGVQAISAPAQVTGLTVTTGNAQNLLGWAAPSNGGSVVTGYKVYRSTSAGAETLLTTLGAVLTYTDTGLTNGTTYYYKVSAVNAVGEGALSAEASGAPSAGGAGTHYLNLTGATASRAGTPSTSALNVTGNLDIRVKAALASWTPAATNALVSKWGASVPQYYLFIDTAGKVNLAFEDAGVVGHFPASTVATGLATNAVKWIRATLAWTAATGGTWTTTFYTSDDGTTWTQLGAAVAITGVASSTLQVGTANDLEIGAQTGGTADMATGKVYFAQVMSGATVVAAVDFSNATPGATTVVGSTGETWTVNSPASIV